MPFKLKCIAAIFFISIVACTKNKKYNYNDLVQSVQKGDIKGLNQMLHFVDVNITDSIGNTVLMFAVKKNNVQMVKQLLQLRADPNLINNQERSALDMSRDNKTEKISEIIKDFQYKDWKKHDHKFSEEFFEYAIKNDNSNIVEAFLINGKNVNDAIVSNGLSPIVQALFENSKKVVFLLLDNNVNPNESFDTRPIITIAAMFNQYEIVKKLIEKGANVNAVDGPLTTALMFAAEEGNIDLVKLLIINGANTTIVDRKNETALDKAKEKNHIKIVDYLLQNIRD